MKTQPLRLYMIRYQGWFRDYVVDMFWAKDWDTAWHIYTRKYDILHQAYLLRAVRTPTANCVEL